MNIRKIKIYVGNENWETVGRVVRATPPLDGMITTTTTTTIAVTLIRVPTILPQCGIIYPGAKPTSEPKLPGNQGHIFFQNMKKKIAWTTPNERGNIN